MIAVAGFSFLYISWTKSVDTTNIINHNIELANEIDSVFNNSSDTLIKLEEQKEERDRIIKH